MWFLFAWLSAPTSNLATTICTLVVLAMARETVFRTDSQEGVFLPSAKRSGILFGLTADAFRLLLIGAGTLRMVL